MALSKFEQAKIIILSGDYNREILTKQLEAYKKRNIITKEEFDILINMMDAKDLIITK